MTKRNQARGAHVRRNALAVALAVGLGFTGVALAQSTAGAIFGNAPSAEGQTVKVTSESGLTRTVSVAADGRYTVGNLPVGTYTVTLSKGGETVSTRNNVSITVGAGTEVDFASTTNLGSVQVNANALPAIDVTSVSSNFTVTAEQLERLPIGRSAESIALLAPGVVGGSGAFGNSVTGPVVSFGGAGVTENAYYVNGINTTALYDYTGSAYQLPYGSISQQENLTGGYSAKYGRSDGGVINQVGKRGTNEWHFGGQVVWTPRSLRADPKNTYYKNVALPGEVYASDQVKPGDLQWYRNANKGWETQYSAYIGGPLVKDKLFIFLSAEQTKDGVRNNTSVATGQDRYYKNRDLKYYGKLDWNINENNVFEFTELKQKAKNRYGEGFFFDNDTKTDLASSGPLSYLDYSYETRIFHYTSYLSDAATLSVLYGYTNVKNPTIVPNATDLPFISGALSQDPAITGGTAIRNNQTVATIGSPNAAQKSKNLRVDFSYQLGDHLLEAGIDNVSYGATDQGRQRSGPGYVWIYARSANPGDNIRAPLGVGPAGGNGYYVYKDIFKTITSLGAQQKAYYIQDKWQISDNLLLNLGIRNDEFSNQNNIGQNFVDEKNQWEPRLGFSWDVNGDSSLKIYGNLGRYYLALPQAVGERAATASTTTDQYFTYTGIDANGEPTGLKEVPGVNGAPPPGPVSSNNEYGLVPNPGTVTSTNLRAQYQDELILGFDKTLGPNWVYGAKATYRKLQTIIDDVCDTGKIADKIAAMGLNPDDYQWADPGCRLFNPGGSNRFKVLTADGSSSISVNMTNADWGTFPKPKRKYYALDLYLEHPFDGTWTGRVDYVFSRSYGNAEGQVRSDLGQTDISKTEDWDYVQIMSGAGGDLANDRRHQIKAYGAWQVTPEWLVSGTLRIQSGGPKSCLGFYGPDQSDVGLGYGSDYHWCRGKVFSPGSERLPWTKTLNLGVTYRPAFADHKLAFKMNIYNVTNEQATLQTDPNLHPRYSLAISNTYDSGLYFQAPRSIQLSASYDY
ncbi:TonB-dependent receptor [Oleiagrimonas soli]|uniref:Oar protein n=1 Tax=Oleiagrimonas soli TaxID=1543381 RepID=A0A099CSM3_9GAMM|nr:carboxypeptidase regulatory-like domain-containing protein [Oleiagrimonas soli]KGI76607.1 Oar protein [Oleiagrimonas soli]MBB6184910.1 hypothetical protein [Oleiagrimonas soli]